LGEVLAAARRARGLLDALEQNRSEDVQRLRSQLTQDGDALIYQHARVRIVGSADASSLGLILRDQTLTLIAIDGRADSTGRREGFEEAWALENSYLEKYTDVVRREVSR